MKLFARCKQEYCTHGNRIENTIIIVGLASAAVIWSLKVAFGG